ncbi:hypothetical protein QYF61_007584 [Mycteria americana]|uniref:Uncharacterized protein n=1 Tax=Mycteria americana TaxID=33587 RepID=A0AAN7NCT6_MYCAM|nr:hypothetical protein QYF61_007584 [Mycteria americana]
MCAHSPESQPYPGLHQKDCGQQVKGGDSPPLLRSRETPPPPPQCCIRIWGPQHRKDMDLLEQVQRRAHKCPEGWNTSPGAYKKDGDRLFNKACSKRTRGNGFKLKEEECVMWQGKTFIWRPDDKVEGKGEVKLKREIKQRCVEDIEVAKSRAMDVNNCPVKVASTHVEVDTASVFIVPRGYYNVREPSQGDCHPLGSPALTCLLAVLVCRCILFFRLVAIQLNVIATQLNVYSRLT